MTEVVLRAGPSLHPVEAAIVRLALQLPSIPQDHAWDLWNHDQGLPAGVVCLRHDDRMADADGDADADADADADCLTRVAGNALARLVRIAAEPAAHPVVAGATRRKPVRLPRVRLLVSTLISVCWPSDGARNMVSEVYRLAWLADADQWVVTAARSDAGDGVETDHLLATFGHRADLVAAAGEVICAHWVRLHRKQGVAGRCAIVSGGRIEPAAAFALAAQVWPTPVPQPVPSHHQRSAPSRQVQWALA